jgi:diadenosine tetraphosphatase ApaH/serine/threonine PP2A family protein phosphatase
LPMWDQLSHLTLIGHSHLCKVFALTQFNVTELPAQDLTLDPTLKYIISVGSVGQPRDGDNRASYTLFDSETSRFEFKRIEYDVEAASGKVFNNNLERNFGNRLYIGA